MYLEYNRTFRFLLTFNLTNERRVLRTRRMQRISMVRRNNNSETPDAARTILSRLVDVCFLDRSDDGSFQAGQIRLIRCANQFQKDFISGRDIAPTRIRERNVSRIGKVLAI